MKLHCNKHMYNEINVLTYLAFALFYDKIMAPSLKTIIIVITYNASNKKCNTKQLSGHKDLNVWILGNINST